MHLATEDRIVSPKAVIAKTSLSRTTLWRLSRRGEFPAPVRLSTNRIGWSLKAVEAWVASRTPNQAEAA
jgi:prophage regulatory protein